MYQVEARLKRDFLAARAAPQAAPPQPRAPRLPMFVRRHVIGAVALLLASFLVSDLVAGWGGPFTCPA
jgi:hypothetical protein